MPLKSSQASYRMRVLSSHGLIEPVDGCRRHQLTRAGRPIVAFLVKLYRHLLTPVINAAADGIHQFRSAIAADPIAESLHSLLITLGIARPRPLTA